MTTVAVFTVAHYFPDPLNRISYYPGETYTPAQLAARGMTERDIEHHRFRGNLVEAETAAPVAELGVESSLFLEAAAVAPVPPPPEAAAAEAASAEPAAGSYTGEAAKSD